MAIDFPTSPTPNQLHTVGSRSWTWNNSVGAWYAVNAGVQGIQGIQGAQGTQGLQGITGSQGTQGTQGSQGTQGIQGIQGITGLAFTIAKTYLSVAALNADTAPTAIVAGQFALINTTNVEDAENSRLYIWTGSTYTFVDDLSGSAGIQGITGSQGVQGIQGIQGITGTQGAAGSQGTQGTQGLQGIQGISGASILGTANTFTNTNAFTSVSASGNVNAGSTTGWEYGALGRGSFSAANSSVTGAGILQVLSTESQAADLGGSISLGGYYIAQSNAINFAMIAGRKTNSTGSNTEGYLSLAVRPNGGNMTEYARLTSTGLAITGTLTTTGAVTVGNGTAYAATTMSSSVWADVILKSSTNTHGGSIIWNNGTANKGEIFYYHAADYMQFNTNSVERMRINSSGNVGVGTTGTSPGSARLMVVDTNKAIDSGGILFVASSDAQAINKGGQITLGGGYTDAGAVQYFANIAGRKEDAVSGNLNGYLALATASGGTQVERIRITSAGNVGIGTASPGKLLEVNKNLATNTVGSGEVLRLIGDDGNNVSRVTEIGFGTGPTSGVYSPVLIGAVVTSATGYNTKDLYFATRSGTADSVATERMRITSTGNVITSAGSAISYGAGETYIAWTDELEYSIADSSADSNYKTMKTFVASKSGSFKFKFSGYIQAGTYYFGWRLLQNSVTVASSGHHASGLDTGQVTEVHAYRRFVGTVSSVTPGDIFQLQMVSSDGSGNPVAGNGQLLYAKEFRIYSTTPALDHGGSTNVFGNQVGIGITAPGAPLEIYKEGFNADVTGGGIILSRFTAALSGSYRGAAIYNRYISAGSSNDCLVFAVSSGSNPYTDFTKVKMVITDDGNVGIGTASPVSKLHVSGTAQTVLTITGDSDNSGDAGYTGITLNWSGAERWNIGPAGTGTTSLVFRGASSNVMTLTTGGALTITGALSKGSGSFRIEHPLLSKSATHQLVHSFIEGPKCDLIYRGKVDLVDGKASVNIDTDSTMTEGTFEALCTTVQCFTSNESGWGAIRGKVIGNILTIEAQDAASTDNVSWMVIGERKDKHILDTDWTDSNGRPIVEPLKPVESVPEATL